jgi:hypothetical protein
MSQISKNNITNNVEIRVIGLQRTGNHAIINWIGSQYPGKRVYLLNHVKVKKNPFKYACSQEGNETIIFNNFKINRDDEIRGKFTKKDCIIYSYEDCTFKDIFNKYFIKKLPSLIGESKIKYNILILRDPFNLFASRLYRELTRSNNKISILNNKKELIKLWKDYAKEFLGKTNHIKDNKVVINYNLWYKSKDYRKNLSCLLKIPFSDKGFKKIVSIGGGSSFQGHSIKKNEIFKKITRLLEPNFYESCFKNKKISKFIRRVRLSNKDLDVLQRWKSFKDNQFYKSLFENKELIELSNKIFGKIPGTEVLLNPKKPTKSK